MILITSLLQTHNYRNKPHLFAADFPALSIAGAAPDDSSSDAVFGPAGSTHLSGAQGGGQLPEDLSLPLASTPPALPGGAGDGQISDSQPKIAGLFLSPPVDTPYCRSSVRRAATRK